MPIYLKNEDAFNSYIAKLVYKGHKPDIFTKDQMHDGYFIDRNKDKIIKAVVYSWLRDNARDYLADKENAPFLERVKSADEDSSEWLKLVTAAGKPVYIFDEAKIPNSVHTDLQNVADYLYCPTEEYMEDAMGKFWSAPFSTRIFPLDALSRMPFAVALDLANLWVKEGKPRESYVSPEYLLANTRFVKYLGDNIKAVELEDSRAFDVEANYLGHWGNGWPEKGGFFKGRECCMGGLVFYSIRKRNSTPLVTIVATRDGRMLTCRSKGGELGVYPQKLTPYVRKFISYKGLFVGERLEKVIGGECGVDFSTWIRSLPTPDPTANLPPPIARFGEFQCHR